MQKRSESNLAKIMYKASKLLRIRSTYEISTPKLASKSILANKNNAKNEYFSKKSSYLFFRNKHSKDNSVEFVDKWLRRSPSPSLSSSSNLKIPKSCTPTLNTLKKPMQRSPSININFKESPLKGNENKRISLTRNKYQSKKILFEKNQSPIFLSKNSLSKSPISVKKIIKLPKNHL